MAAGVGRAIQLLRNGTFNRRRIRERALELAELYRAALNAEVQAIFEAHGVHVDAKAWFAEHFRHKMGL